MKLFRVGVFCATLLFPLAVSAAQDDLVLSPANFRFSTNTFLEGKTVRIYATVTSASDNDLRGVVKFFDGKEQIKGDQPVSVLAGKEDSVFADWVAESGDHTLKALLVPFENDNDDPSNNYVEKTVTVFADTDRDGKANKDDPDDDNDGVLDDTDAFPLNKNESLDTDGDTLGNNKDEDDDNDGLPDTEETKIGTDPLKLDTDGDSVNDKNDPYPLDPKRSTYDYDRDGTQDSTDSDADNDGIPKTQDVNDVNIGPVIAVTSEGKNPKRFVLPNEPISFETTTSTDPDGKIAKTEWSVDGKKLSGEKLQTAFDKPGKHIIAVTVFDDKNESRSDTFSLWVIPPWLPWTLIALFFLLFILAIFLVFSYSKRRRSRWESIHKTLDTILKWLPAPHKK